MEGSARLAAAQHQLDLVLGFFGRVDAKMSVVLGIDLAMLGVLFSKAAAAKSLPVLTWVAGTAFVLLLLASFLQLFRGSFPNINGGHASLVFFREINNLRESEFRDAYSALSADQLAKDYLEQAWRNSKILTTKFDLLKSAYTWMAWATLPWSLTLIMIAHQGS